MFSIEITETGFQIMQGRAIVVDQPFDYRVDGQVAIPADERQALAEALVVSLEAAAAEAANVSDPIVE